MVIPRRKRERGGQAGVPTRVRVRHRKEESQYPLEVRVRGGRDGPRVDEERKKRKERCSPGGRPSSQEQGPV